MINKKIALVSGSYYGQVMGGAEYQQFLLGKHLKDLKYKVFYIFADNKDLLKHENEFELLRVRRRLFLRKLLGRCFFLDFFKLLKYFADVEPAVIIVRGGFAYMGIAAQYCADRDCKLIWQIASRKDLEPWRFALRRTIVFDYIDKKFLEYGIRRADCIIGQAEYQDELLFKNYQRRCAAIVPNFHPLPEERIDKQDPVKVVWVANFKETKRPELFVNLASEFKERKDAKFIMVGRNSSSGCLKDIGSKIVWAENIDYMGELPIADVNTVLSGSHILVNTSEKEGFPNTFIQAWMRKVPVVSLNVDPDDVIKKNKIGFHSGNFEQMAKDVQLLISDESLREEMGERARQFAFQNFSMKNMNKIIDLIER